MSILPTPDDAASGHVSTGHLPPRSTVAELVTQAYERHRSNTDGANSQVYPALARARSDLFGISVVSTDGASFGIGDDDHPFPIMSVSKPFVFALICELLGATAARDRLGANSTGLPFDSLAAVEGRPDGRTNPMVNPGAITTTSLVPGSGADRWAFIVDGLSRFAGRLLEVDHEVYVSASATNHRNRAIAAALDEKGQIQGDPAEAVDLYTRQCCLAVTAHDLAVMGATLADGGVHPVTRERVVSPDAARRTLALMATAGLYETSGDWLYDIGLPGKSGIGGGIVTVAPGKGGLGTFAPPLDASGNSVKGQLVTTDLSHALGLDLFLSAPED